MKSTKKKALSLILTLSMLAATSVPTFASETQENNADATSIGSQEQVDYTDQFNSFVTKAFANIDTLRVYDRSDVEVTDEFKQIYYTEGLIKAHEYIQQNECSLRYQVIEESDDNTRDTIKARTVYEYFYECVTCTDGTYTKEWDAELRGTYSYNVNTNKITSTKSPTLSLRVAEFGAMWSAYMNNVSTSYSLSSNSVTYSGKYHMYGTLSPITGVSLTKDFKSHSVSFTSYL